MSKGSWYFICFVASIVALTCVIKVKPRSRSFLSVPVLLFEFGIIFSIFLANAKIFLTGIILATYFLCYGLMCIDEKKAQDRQKQKELSEHLQKLQQLSKHPIRHRYKIYSVRHFEDYFGLISEYYSAYDQGLLDDPEDGEYPLYEYRNLDCKLEQDETRYKVFVNTEQGWNYCGYMDKTVTLEYDIENMKSWHVEVDGGSTYVVVNGKYRKVWQPLHFTLVIDLRDTDE